MVGSSRLNKAASQDRDYRLYLESVTNPRYPCVSARGNQHNTPQTAGRHRLTAHTSARPLRLPAFNLPWPCTTFQPGHQPSTYRVLTLAGVSELRPSLTLGIHAPTFQSIPIVQIGTFPTLPVIAERKRSMMCDYTQVEYACGHLRFTVRAWCESTTLS